MPLNLPATICILPVFIPIAHAAHLPLRTRVISSTVSRKIELSWLAGWSALFCIFAFYTAIETAAVDLGEKSKKKKILNDMKTCFPGKPIVIGWPAVNQSWWRNCLRRISHLRNNQFQLGRTWKLQVSIHRFMFLIRHRRIFSNLIHLFFPQGTWVMAKREGSARKGYLFRCRFHKLRYVKW